MGEEMVFKQSTNSKQYKCLVREIYESLKHNYKSAKFITGRAIFTSRYEFVDTLNAMLITKFLSESKTYISFDSAKNDINNYYQ